MFLLQARTRLVKHFQYPPSVKYAILSHTFSSPSHNEWPLYESSELAHSYAPSLQQHIIDKTCELALENGVEFVWIDAVCVDKTSTARISETINSIANYFKMATICFAYLFDLPCGELSSTLWGRCQFWSRVWTLQELIFPPRMYFYDAKWHFRGERSSEALSPLLSNITGIDQEILIRHSQPHSISAARKLCWAANRKSIRPEDAAYAVIGLFNISMTIIYGEGGLPAFIRLQEHIFNRTNDGSLLLWTAKGCEDCRGIFAHDAQEFVPFGKSSAGKRPLPFSGFAISTSQGVLLHGSITVHRGFLFLHLGTPMDMNASKDQYGILLHAVSQGLYGRTMPQKVFQEPGPTIRSISTVVVTREDRGLNSLVGRKVLAEGCESLLATGDLPESRVLGLHELPGLERASESPADIEAPSTPGSMTAGWIDTNLDSDQFSIISDNEKSTLQDLIERHEEWDTDAASRQYRTSSDDNSKQSHNSDVDLEAPWTHNEKQQMPRVTFEDLQINCASENQTERIAELAKSIYSHFLETQKSPSRISTRDIRVMRNRSRRNGLLMGRRRHQRWALPATSELSCPFYTKDPSQHADCLQHHKFKTMHDIRSHLWTTHRLPYYCPTCKLSFELAAKRDQHIVQRSCHFIDENPHVGVSEDHKKLISRIDTTQSSKTQWFQVWDVLFPDSVRPKSPHPSTRAGFEVVRFRKYWHETGVLLVERLLHQGGIGPSATEGRRHHYLFSTAYTQAMKLLVNGLTEPT